jgi:hypothetical protein
MPRAHRSRIYISLQQARRSGSLSEPLLARFSLSLRYIPRKAMEEYGLAALIPPPRLHGHGATYSWVAALACSCLVFHLQRPSACRTL